MNLVQISILATIQGVAELLPVSSSAHVIVAMKRMGLDPVSPETTFLLVMLHTGTMFAVIVYFWRAWKAAYFSSAEVLKKTVGQLAVATAATGLVGLGLMALIPRAMGADASAFEVEQLFGNSRWIACALAAAGTLIIASSRIGERQGTLSAGTAALIGAVQGLCLPFRGFSRSGATISAGLVCGVARDRAEQFSFALAVVLTPAVIAREAMRVYRAQAMLPVEAARRTTELVAPGVLGMGLSFLAGLLALRWLSRWLQADRWHLFGIYCLVAAAFIYRS